MSTNIPNPKGLRIPFATQHPTKMKERGPYPDGYLAGPRGAVIHFTAGRYEKGLANAHSAIDEGIKNGYTYLCIATTGDLVQAHDVLQWGYHAGNSGWKEKLARLSWVIKGAVSDDLIGIEINNAGKLEKTADGRFKTWFGTYIPEDQVRYVTEKEYGCPTGYYHKYTKEQEETLEKVLIWLYVNCPSFKLEYVLGHHEVSGLRGIGFFRKNDPGGALSFPLDKYRKYLIENKSALQVKHGIKRIA